MSHRKHRPLARTRALPQIILLLVVGMVGACDDQAADSTATPCDRPESSWCEGSVIVSCGADLYHPEPGLETGIDCADYDAGCIELTPAEYPSWAACAPASQHCNQEGTSYCVTDRIMETCQADNVYTLSGCGSRKCYQHSWDEALCLYAPGTCDYHDSPHICWETDERFYVSCNSAGYWSDLQQCPDGMICVEDTDGFGECIKVGQIAD